MIQQLNENKACGRVRLSDSLNEDLNSWFGDKPDKKKQKCTEKKGVKNNTVLLNMLFLNS